MKHIGLNHTRAVIQANWLFLTGNLYRGLHIQAMSGYKGKNNQLSRQHHGYAHLAYRKRDTNAFGGIGWAPNLTYVYVTTSISTDVGIKRPMINESLYNKLCTDNCNILCLDIAENRYMEFSARDTRKFKHRRMGADKMVVLEPKSGYWNWTEADGRLMSGDDTDIGPGVWCCIEHIKYNNHHTSRYGNVIVEHKAKGTTRTYRSLADVCDKLKLKWSATIKKWQRSADGRIEVSSPSGTKYIVTMSKERRAK